MCMRHIVIGGLCSSSICFHITSYTEQFSEKKIEHKMCVLISLQLLIVLFLILRRTE